MYILPVKESFAKSKVVCLTDMDEEKTEPDKKEKSKDLFTLISSDLFLTETHNTWHQHDDLNITLEFHIIDTPPPDNNI